jgi:16S rRNA (adenine1518-N6/adenine1519-N6)-dimethyltransferase
VNSSVVRLDVRPQPAVAVADESAFFKVVRAGFSAKRKQLRNSLSHGLGVHPTMVGELLEDLEFDGRRRAETLTLEEWALIYEAWEELSRRPE